MHFLVNRFASAAPTIKAHVSTIDAQIDEATSDYDSEKL